MTSSNDAPDRATLGGMTPLRLSLALCLAACARPTPPGEGEARAKDPCSAGALGLGEAKPVVRFDLPTGCSARAQGGAPVVIGSDAERDEKLECPPDMRPKLDFGAQALVIAQLDQSPATVGFDVLDDGKTVTFVSHFRPSCPGDPLPMPIQVTRSFVVSPNAPRTFGQARCTLARDCK
jgi:hypothetical protein